MAKKSILIIRCGALGDLIYATSVIDALKLEFGQDTIIDFVTATGVGTLFDKDTRVDRVFPLRHKKTPIWLSSEKKAIISHSKSSPYDILINFEFGKQYKSLVENIEAKKKVGALVQEIVLPVDARHMVEITKFIFKDIVSEEIYKKSFPKIQGTSKEEVIAKYNLDNNYIVISPSNSHQKRNLLNYRAWENSSWVELIAELSKYIQVVIVGNRGEDEFFVKLKPYPKNVVDLVAKTSLVDLVGVIDGACGLVATDTGTAHMASAVDTEVFALIGPTPASHTGPYQTPFNKVHIISVNLDCSPCYKTEVMKNCKDNICMKQITTKMVMDEIKSANIL